MNREEAEQFVRERKQAVLATTTKDGRIHTSNVLVVYHEGKLLCSITETRVKYRHILRDPHVTVHLLGDSFWTWLAVQGTVTLQHMPDALPMLHTYYELATGGPHPDWDDYDRAMAEDRRVLGYISIDRMYPIDS